MPTRRHALVALAIIAVSVAAGWNDPTAGALLGGVVACAVVGLRVASSVRTALFTAGAIVALTALNQVAEAGAYSALDDLVFFTLILGTPALVGHVLGRRAELIAELTARAETLRVAREEDAAAAVAEERARVAIGVHDALAHRVGELSLHAAGALRVAADEPDRALAALGRIEDAGRAALDDIRAVIGVLRADDPLALGPLDAPDRQIPSAPSRDVAPSTAPEHRAAPTAAPSRLDVAIAVAVFVAFTIETLTSSKLEGPAALNVLGIAAIAAPLAARRRAPLPAMAATCLACVPQALWLTSPGVLVTPIVLLLLPPYTLGAHLPLRPALLGLAISFAASLALEPSVLTGLFGLLAFAAGRLVRDRSRRAAELDAITAELDRTRGAHAARRRSEERLRIARELHDAVAHSMTVIVLQAGAARRVWGRDPKAARIAVGALTGVARETLAELRVTLRDDVIAPDDLDELAARLRPLGVAVTVHRDGPPPPPEVERVVFAVVREALTNVTRHAAPTAADVVIAASDRDVVVSVTDQGRTGAAQRAGVDGTGTGLRGLGERVASAGGELHYGPHGPGFRVEARIPVTQAVLA